MTAEAAFLAAVADRPGDPTPRLVYADWLDDRGDPRAELVRIEEEMRTLPAHADRYWSLKPRRNELRAGCSPDWLAALGYGTVYRPVLAPWPGADVRGRFRLLRELVERWYGEPLPDAGGRADEVAAVEERLGRTLPVAVREWIAFAFELADAPGNASEPLRDPFHPDTIAEHPALISVSLLEQAEGDVLWAVPADRLGEADPPVLVHYDDYGDRGGFEEAGESLGTVTEFTLGYVLGYLGGGPGYSVGLARAIVLLGGAREVFPPPVTIGAAQAFEADGVLAVYGSVSEEDNPGNLRLDVWTRGLISDPAVARWVEALRRR